LAGAKTSRQNKAIMWEHQRERSSAWGGRDGTHSQPRQSRALFVTSLKLRLTGSHWIVSSLLLLPVCPAPSSLLASRALDPERFLIALRSKTLAKGSSPPTANSQGRHGLTWTALRSRTCCRARRGMMKSC